MAHGRGWCCSCTRASSQTGLDLVDFPTLVWCEVEYSVYAMRQANRRSWRISQYLPVRVIYLAYSGTLQARALALVAKKLMSSLAVEGELVEEGLATHGDHGDHGDDMLLSLARSLTDHTETNAGPLEALFAECESRKVKSRRRCGRRISRQRKNSPRWWSRESRY